MGGRGDPAVAYPLERAVANRRHGNDDGRHDDEDA